MGWMDMDGGCMDLSIVPEGDDVHEETDRQAVANSYA